jgi:L-threonylcarbamoyladenylate synthase
MLPHVVAVHPDAPDPAVIADAAARLHRGALVAFPTETVYGLGANALDPEAVARIYVAKGRPAWNPVIAHVPGVMEARQLARRWPESAERLAAAFWPGPLTLVVPKAAHVPDIVTAGLDAVAVRVPSHPVALALLRATGLPIAAPSANRFTEVSPTTARHVVHSLGARVPLVLDGGPCPVGIESTVVECTGDDVIILRPGMLGRAALEAALVGTGIVVRDAAPSRVAHEALDVAGARSPGMSDRHYAPRAEVWLFTPDQREEMEAALRSRRDGIASGRSGGPVVGLLRTVTLAPEPDLAIRLPTDPADYARALYASLHEADARAASLVVIEAPPADAAGWDGVRDRLTRAAR